MNIPKRKPIEKFQVVVCASSLTFDAWKLYKWIESFKKSGTEVEPILIHSELNHDSLFYWPYQTLEIEELFTFTNIDFMKYHTKNMYEMKSIFVKMLAYKYVGSCLVFDADCHINQKLTIDMIPECSWGSVVQYNKIPGKQHEWSSLEYNQFDEADYVELIHNEFMIFNKDYSDTFFELFHKYKDQFYNMSYYPNYANAIMSLTHKIVNGTYLCSDWCYYFNDGDNDTSICKLYSGDDGFNRLFKDTYDIPDAEVSI